MDFLNLSELRPEIFGDFLPFVFLLFSIIANLFPGIPEEVFLILLGHFSSVNSSFLSFFEMCIMVIFGFLLVDSLEYYLSNKGSKIIHYISDKVLGINLEKNRKFFENHIGKTIFISRFLVQFRALGPIVSGTYKFPFLKFIFIDFLALIFYVPLMMWLGFYFSNRIEKIIEGANIINNIFFGFLILIIFIILIRKTRTYFLKYLKK